MKLKGRQRKFARANHERCIIAPQLKARQDATDKQWLLKVARLVAIELKSRIRGTSIRIRIPDRAAETHTDGWSTIIGDLGKSRPRLHVWYDRFSGHENRKLWVGYYSENRKQLVDITKRVQRELTPVRVITSEDYLSDKHVALTDQLPQKEFRKPILEKFPKGETYFGLYDPTEKPTDSTIRTFQVHAVAFLESVARTLPRSQPEDETHEAFSKCENKKLVAAHIRRERSRLLAAECKIRDKYECQVCELVFVDSYGKLGIEFAEAHHRVPLSKLRENVRTKVDDLATVCANCHRMLHRMDGRHDDIKKLRTILHSHRP